MVTVHGYWKRRSRKPRYCDRPAACALAALALAACVPLAPAQVPPGEQQPLVPADIEEYDIEMSGRFARQWTDEDGTLVLIFQGDFRMDAGGRRLSAHDAVVWITPGVSEPMRRPYYDLTVYLWRDAEVRDVGGTVQVDHVLLVSNLRTFGRIVKQHDAHTPEAQPDSPLYRQALRDRVLIESGVAPPTKPGERDVEVARPSDVPAVVARRRPRVIRYRLPQTEPAMTPAGEQVLVARGNIYFSSTSGGAEDLLEIRARNAVVFPGDAGAAALLEGADGLEGGAQSDESQIAPTPSGQDPPTAQQPEGEEPPAVDDAFRQRISAVYLEGDVVLSYGSRFIRAERLYYDFRNDRAIILDAVMRAQDPQRNIPIYVRADEVRQLSRTEYSATNARLTTSEFYTPHYHVGASRVLIEDRSSGGGLTRAAGETLSGTYELRDTTLNVGGVPVLWWPYSRGTFADSETALKRLRSSYSDDFGVSIESTWNLLQILGAPKPDGFDANLRLDYFSERGPAIGIDSDYSGEDFYGLARSYFVYDQGEDSLGPLREETPESRERGRLLLRHRQFLPLDWQATIELSYVSDPNFLEEWEKSEWFEGKEQETLFHLKRAKNVEAISILANWRLLDFVTQTEHLPELTYRRIGDTLLEPLVFYHESRIGMARYRPDDRRPWYARRYGNTDSTDSVFRGDVREEVELPLKLGPLNMAPYVTLRGTFWDSAPHRDGALWRGYISYGVRGGTSLSRVFEDIESELLDIHRIRHIIKPEFAVWYAHSTADSRQITPFDEGIETIDDFYGGRFAIKQIWQTQRGAQERRRTVDLLTVNLEVGVFGDAQRHERSNGYANPIRPEDSRTRNYFAGDVIWRLSDTTSLLYDFNFDLNDRSFDRHNVSLAVERLPRLAYVLGLRHAGDIDMSLIGGGFNYRLSEKHILAVRSWYDIERGAAGEIAVSYIRKLPRWYFSINAEWDQVNEDFSLSITLWPEGIPEWTLGSRRFTGVATTTGIKP